MTGVTYDTGLLIAADRGQRVALAFHKRRLTRRVVPSVPAAVLAQAWRGGPQAGLSRVLAGCRVEALDEELARAAGRLCARAGTSDATDAAVVVGAARRNDMIVTSDPSDIRRLLDAAGAQLQVVVV